MRLLTLTTLCATLSCCSESPPPSFHLGVEPLRLGARIQEGTLALWPVLEAPGFCADDQVPDGFWTLDEALSAGAARLEAADTLNGPQLVNDSGRSVLLVASEVLPAGDRDLLVERDRFLPPHSVTELEAVGMERSRWSWGSDPPYHTTVCTAVLEDEPARAMRIALAGTLIERLEQADGNPVGLVVAFDWGSPSEERTAEIFGDARLFSRYRGKLVQAYALYAVARLHGRAHPTPAERGQVHGYGVGMTTAPFPGPAVWAEGGIQGIHRRFVSSPLELHRLE